jgi:hypothetical protein
MFKNKLSKEQLVSFDKCVTEEDYFKWHQVNTPWFEEKVNRRIARLYEDRPEKDKPFIPNIITKCPEHKEEKKE